MYIPKHSKENDPALLLEVMQRYNLATLVTTVDGVPLANHVPVLTQSYDSILHIEGHLARANPHWQAMAGGATTLVIFQGPHTYISPTLYRSDTMVPTWNYIAVHASGTATVSHAAQNKLATLQALVQRHEPAWQERFDQFDASSIDSLLGAIVAFDIAVKQVEGKFKLGQHRLAQDRPEMQQSHETGDENRRDIAQWMRRLGYWE